jgi:eukaryotic-like serine/threonine-protein kinase
MMFSQTMFRGRSSAPLELLDDAFEQLDPTVRLGPAQPLNLASQVPFDLIGELGPYRLLRQLGSGGMGIVFEAEEIETGELIALKVLRPTLVMDPEAKIRFFREAQAMAAIDHQRIVPVIRVGEAQGIPYIAMPLLLGETLEDRLDHLPLLAVEEIVRIGIEIAEGLDAAHRHGLIHRDVKPANVWLEEPFGSVRLLDLGLAREITRDALLTHSGIVMGTPAFMSPEQARGDQLDPRSDLFSLGCILYKMSVGVRPFNDPTPMGVLNLIQHHHPPRVSAMTTSVPTMLSNLIMELLAKQPKDRPASAAVVMERLRRIPLHESARPSKHSIDLSRPLEPEVSFPSDHIRALAGNWLFVGLSVLVAVSCGVWFLAGR